MNDSKLILVGSIKNGEILRDWYRQGFIFKDEDAYLHRPDDPCYVPELSDDIFTARDFLEIAKGNKYLADAMFYSVDWKSPYTWIDEYEIYDEEEELE